MNIETEVKKRRTFAIISHPDAGKTTITEKLLLFGGAIQLAGTVKGRKASRHATSDWMELEKQRGISVTTSVMQFEYNKKVVNLLDTPGHEDFSEDTYRTLTAVDSALMVIDAVKGVESRTIKLMEVCRMRTTPIITFINKMDRETRDPLDLLDEIEKVLNIHCVPITWPISMGKSFRGVYHILKDEVILFDNKNASKKADNKIIKGLNNPELEKIIPDELDDLKMQIELLQGAGLEFNLDQYLAGEITPVFFGSALQTFGIRELLDMFTEVAPYPKAHQTTTREVQSIENKFSGFVFKIQANMDPRHRDRIAFMRVCSGEFQAGMKVNQVRIGKEVKISSALTFFAAERDAVENAYAGDIIGLPNHGTIQIGDTFTEGEDLKFLGVPNFAPELFRRVVLKDPLKMKALQKGLVQLSEEGATQVFRPERSNELILGAVGVLQFDVVAHRLKYEYNVECSYDNINIYTIRWIKSNNNKKLEEFKNYEHDKLGFDGSENLVYLATSRANLDLVQERWPEIEFMATCEV